MKKLFSALIILASVLMLSGCFFYFDDDDTPSTPYYTITCHNESDTKISDWCAVKDGRVTYAKAKNDCCPISGNGGTSTMTLPKGTYIVYVAFVSDPDYEKGDYIETRSFKLDKDIDVYIDQTYVPKRY